ncbi:GGDEF domain-containing protein [Sulfurimonas marina]|uniref:diguanylate cyclase n=1 Tax=Sulfurimonas marina TaxID=2590551 RepID=A0A7M1AW57_9BACT|nr:GGDEF domain-containing protein [Sulfurimonas marina]QOP41701.1 GGDEF domain-containing protein [Sulfurimonas marina]
MGKFKLLKELTVYIDEAFEDFYNTMLHDVRLGVFFESDEQVITLIETQKKHFSASLSLDIEVLKQNYIKLGEFHYDLRIPYIDFMKGTDILEEHFLLNAQKCKSTKKLMGEIFEYFKIMKAFTAKGYLNRMLSEDKRDLETFFEQVIVDTNTYLPKKLILRKIQWLKELLNSIELNEDFNIESRDGFLIKEWLDEMEFLTLEKRTFFEELEQRIYLNTQNLFYFLHRGEYLEILPLYSSLLNVYKLTLMMNNAVTIEYANKVIEDMQLDSLTQLFRKDIFQELLKKEIALVQREENYKISIAYIDLDNFKMVNDSFGHYSGDKVIEKMGESMRNNIRASDMGFRIGGDEFALILKNATKEEAKNVCEKIKADFSSYQFIFNDEVSFSVSVSVGISEFSTQEKIEIEDILKDVDTKLYLAKHKGKNQVCI